MSETTITREEIETLGRYNAEVGRGVAHTPEYAVRMAELQRRFNERDAYLGAEIDRLDAHRTLTSGDTP